MQHGPFTLPTIRYLKPPQVQQYLEGICCSTSPTYYIADWNKIGDYRQRQTDLNTKHENNSRIDNDYKVGGTTYLYGKMVSSVKQKAGITVNHGQSRQFIRMALSGSNAEANRND
jgi:hypothetical protein